VLREAQQFLQLKQAPSARNAKRKKKPQLISVLRMVRASLDSDAFPGHVKAVHQRSEAVRLEPQNHGLKIDPAHVGNRRVE
jgi:hypothetical protein